MRSDQFLWYVSTELLVHVAELPHIKIVSNSLKYSVCSSCHLLVAQSTTE